MTDLSFKIRKRGKSARPERIDIGDDVLVRNDLIAEAQGTCERTVNRGDAKGAPFAFVGGCKYRPERAYRAWLAGLIQVKGQAPARRKAR